MNVTKFQGLQTIFDGHFEDLTPFVQKMRLIKSQDEIDKMIVAGQFADKLLKLVSITFHLTTLKLTLSP